MQRRHRLAFLWGAFMHAALALVVAACNVNPENHFESLSAGTYGPDSGGGSVPADDGTGDETGDWPPEAGACEFDDADCNADEDCCFATQPPGTLAPGSICPSQGFPFNWSCESNACVHTFGASANGCDTDAQCSDLIEGYVCVIDDSDNGRCAPSCSNDGQCVSKYGLPSSFICDNVGGVDFCRQPT